MFENNEFPNQLNQFTKKTDQSLYNALVISNYCIGINDYILWDDNFASNFINFSKEKTARLKLYTKSDNINYGP